MMLPVHTLVGLLFIFLAPSLVLQSCRQKKRKKEKKCKSVKEQNPWERSGNYEGDIIFLNEGIFNVVAEPKRRWPNGELPYEISSGFAEDEKKLILESLDHITNRTCVKFIPRRENDAYGLLFTEEKGYGCAASIGFSNTTQKVYLDPKFRCLRLGVIVHEVLHALGFWHQHSAKNRDCYLEILWRNIRPGSEYNFNISKEPTTSFGFGYDYDSIMHYSSYAFSCNGKKTLLPKVHRLITRITVDSLVEE